MWTTDSKDPDAVKDWRQKKGTKEDEMVGWHHWFSGHVFEQTPGDSEGQGSLACCSLWGRKELDTTERMSNRESSSATSFTQCLLSDRVLRRKETSHRSFEGEILVSWKPCENPDRGGPWKEKRWTFKEEEGLQGCDSVYDRGIRIEN